MSQQCRCAVSRIGGETAQASLLVEPRHASAAFAKATWILDGTARPGDPVRAVFWTYPFRQRPSAIGFGADCIGLDTVMDDTAGIGVTGPFDRSRPPPPRLARRRFLRHLRSDATRVLPGSSDGRAAADLRQRDFAWPERRLRRRLIDASTVRGARPSPRLTSPAFPRAGEGDAVASVRRWTVGSCCSGSRVDLIQSDC
jgi:hypothetical protein